MKTEYRQDRFNWIDYYDFHFQWCWWSALPEIVLHCCYLVLPVHIVMYTQFASLLDMLALNIWSKPYALSALTRGKIWSLFKSIFTFSNRNTYVCVDEPEQVIYLLLPNVAMQSGKMQSLKYVSSVSSPALNLSSKSSMATIYLFAIVLIMT